MAGHIAVLLFACLTWSQWVAVPGQHDLLFGLESSDGNTEFEDNHAQSSCKWNDPPDDGYNFRPCSTGICRGERGSYSPTGTIRFTRCRKNFILSEGYDRDTCENGKWSSSGHKCAPCGRSQNQFNPIEELTLIHHGKNSSRGDFPWMAAIYAVLDGGKWEQICGGTLISPKIVLSAAHCFTISGTALKPEGVKIGLGKLYSDFNSKEPESIISNVKEIIRPERYLGVEHLYDLDIALVVLSESVVTGKNIMPACLDWSATNKPKHDEKGVMAGWGVTESGGRSETLKWAFQKYIAYENCRTMITAADQKFVTHDKFCTGEVQSAKADKGDSGGGLTFVREGTHYVYGIVSTKLFGDERSLRLFTNLMNDGHLAWLLRQWRRLQVQHGLIECTKNRDCSGDDICKAGKCVDPCSLACGENTSCRVVNHMTTCACRPCHVGDPITGCRPITGCDPVAQTSAHMDKKYALVTKKVNWFQAVQDCAKDKRRLATIKNAEEMKKVADLIDANQMTYTTFWLGGNDLATEGTFVWIDTNTPFTYFNFRKGDPNNSGNNEDCVEVWNRSWNDIACYRNEFYICEYY